MAAWAGTDPRANPAATVQAVTARILTATATITTRLDAAGVTGDTHMIADLARSPPHAAQPAAPADAATLPIVGQRAGPLASEIARAHDSAAQLFRSQMPGSWVPGYLASRGLSPAVQDH